VTYFDRRDFSTFWVRMGDLEPGDIGFTMLNQPVFVVRVATSLERPGAVAVTAVRNGGEPETVVYDASRRIQVVRSYDGSDDERRYDG
jgi:hypothetical protein